MQDATPWQPGVLHACGRPWAQNHGTAMILLDPDLRADTRGLRIRGAVSRAWYRVWAHRKTMRAVGTPPAVMATLRNLAISLHRRAGAANIAAACRCTGRHPNRVLRLLI
jgi:hypothetical protein